MNKRAKKFQKVNQKVLIATIDVSKNSHVGYWRYSNGIDSKPFGFANTGEGFKRFWHKIWTAKIIHKADEIIVGFESTGPYAEPLVNYLLKKPVKLVQVNSMHTKRIKELDDNSPRKTDQKDTRVIADIIQFGHYLSVLVPTGAAAELRRLTNARESAVTRRTALINRLQNLFSIIFPEFLSIMKGVHTKSARYLLGYYPMPEDIVALGWKKLAKRLHKVSRGKLGSERAQELFAAAQGSIGITEGKESIGMEIHHILQEISSCDVFINRIEKKMKKYLAEITCSRYLLSIPGVSYVTVSGIIGEVGNFEKIHFQKALIKLAGLDLFEVSSGKHRGTRHISKRGRAILRKMLYYAAINVVRRNGILHEYYQQCIARGMLRMKAIVAVMKKLLRIMFALVSNKKDYNSEYSIQKVA